MIDLTNRGQNDQNHTKLDSQTHFFLKNLLVLQDKSQFRDSFLVKKIVCYELASRLANNHERARLGATSLLCLGWLAPSGHHRALWCGQSGINEVSKTGLLSPLRSKPLVPNRLYFTLVQSEVKPIWDQGFAT